MKDDGEKRVLVSWAGTGISSSMREELWEHSVKFVCKQRLEVGDLVRVIPGKELTLNGTAGDNLSTLREILIIIMRINIGG